MLPIVYENQVEEEINKYQNDTFRSGYLIRKDIATQAFIVSSRAKQDGEGKWPDLQLVLYPNFVFGPTNPLLTMQVISNRAKSIGSVTLNTTAYLDGERNDTKLAIVDHLTSFDSSDIDVLVEGKKYSWL